MVVLTMSQEYKIDLESNTYIVPNYYWKPDKDLNLKMWIWKVRNFGNLSEQTDNSQHSKAFDT